MEHDPHSRTHTGQQQHMKINSLFQTSTVPPFNSNNNSRGTLPLIATTPLSPLQQPQGIPKTLQSKSSLPATTTTITPATPTTTAVEIKIIPQSVNHKHNNNNREFIMYKIKYLQIQTKIVIINNNQAQQQQQPSDTSISQQQSPLQHLQQQQKF